MEDINIQISDLESQIASLPVGYISKKRLTERNVITSSGQKTEK